MKIAAPCSIFTNRLLLLLCETTLVPSNAREFITAQVKSLLLLDPNNEQYLKLQTDLQDAIKLTEGLIQSQQLESATVPSGNVQLNVLIIIIFVNDNQTNTGELHLRKGDWVPKVGDRVEAAWGEKTYPGRVMI